MLVTLLLAFTMPLTADELIVTANKTPQDRQTLIGNATRIDTEALRLVNAQHVHELGNRLPGVWIGRGSGQEHLTAIRSPVLTGAGACGAFLVLENGVATRPSGFCNVNQLFEVTTEFADAIEVIRGPANALYGSNGLHGTINVRLPTADRQRPTTAELSGGPDRYGRLAVQGSTGRGVLDITGGVVADEYDGFRDDSGYAQQKVFVATKLKRATSSLFINLAASNLNQETAGFVRGINAYRDESLRTTNPNPEAFRDANSQRLTMRWVPGDTHDWRGLDVRAWLRRSDMEFLQHFLPGQPLEKNDHLSAGFSATLNRAVGDSAAGTLGVDVEMSRAHLDEFQAAPVDSPSAFLVETRPAGPHYDFDVDSLLVAGYGQATLDLTPRVTLQAGARLELIHYDYDNRLPDGNNRIDGTPCGFGGCLFTRPADRSDNFVGVAPNLGIRYAVNKSFSLYADVRRGYRAPQMTELYRLQNGQSVADLDPETIDAFETGAHIASGEINLEVAAYAMRKRHFIFRDANGFNVSDGRTRHLGVELSIDWRGASGLYAGISASGSRQTYRFDRTVGGGEQIRSGNDIDTAPETLGSARAGYAGEKLQTEIEWVHQGSYALDAANTAEYSGHNIVNWRSRWAIGRQWSIGLRVHNVLDARYADRADFAFGSFRYFPARDREWSVQLAYRAARPSGDAR